MGFSWHYGARVQSLSTTPSGCSPFRHPHRHEAGPVIDKTKGRFHLWNSSPLTYDSVFISIKWGHAPPGRLILLWESFRGDSASETWVLAFLHCGIRSWSIFPYISLGVHWRLSLEASRHRGPQPEPSSWRLEAGGCGWGCQAWRRQHAQWVRPGPWLERMQSRGAGGCLGRCPVGVTPCSSKGGPAAAPWSLTWAGEASANQGWAGGVGWGEDFPPLELRVSKEPEAQKMLAL